MAEEPRQIIVADDHAAPRETQTRTAAQALAPARAGLPTPAEMLQTAVQTGAGVEVLEKLMALQERWERNAARKAFDEAISIAKAAIPPIRKNRRVGFESKRTGDRTDYSYEDFAEVARTVDPILSANGLSYRFRPKQDGAQVSVTCILSHRDGHSEETTLVGGVDTSGNKNAIQGVGSAVTYLQRYTLKAALGLSAAEVDNDGAGAGTSQSPQTITPEQIDELEKLVEARGANLTAVYEYFDIASFAEVWAKNFDNVKQTIMRARGGQKKDDQNVG